jgi:hypothetical protein
MGEVRKRIVGPALETPSAGGAHWLDVQRHAEVEVTSEDAEHPIEFAFGLEGLGFWRAAEPGAQTLRLRFDEAQRLRRIRLVFEEREVARTQEFVLRWSGDGGSTFRDIVRQQFTFSPPDTVREVEDYSVQLEGVTGLELHVTPNISGGTMRASLAAWAVA